MIAADFAPFLEAWLRIGESFNARPSDDAVRDVFGALAEFDLAEVSYALGEHLKHGEFMVRPFNVRKILLGELPDDQIIKAFAINAERRPTILGVLARSLVGHRTMTEGDERAIYFGVQGIRPMLEEVRARAHVGEFTDEELRRLVAAECRPSGDLAPGVPGCRAAYRAPLQQRCRELLGQKKIAAPTAPVVSASGMREDGTAAPRSAEERERSDRARRELAGALGLRSTSPAREAARASSLKRDEGRATA